MNTLFGLIGKSLSHSMSPRIHELIFEKLGMHAYYHLFEIEETKLKKAIEGLAAIGAVGVNVTVPYKVKVMDYIDRLSPEAESIGSVNCITFNSEGTVGYNTDYMGFGMLLKRYEVELTGKSATILGSGGASKTVIRFLLDNGIDNIIVASRNTPDSDLRVKYDTSGKVRFINYRQLSEQAAGDLIVNCTPCGMFPHVGETPVEIDVLCNFNTAVDIIYNPLETKFLEQAGKAGLKTLNGLYMLVSQAVAAQEIWNDLKFSQSTVDDIYDMVGSYMTQNRY